MATFLREEGELAVLKLKAGSTEQEIRIPRSMLPKEIKTGEDFTLSFQPEEAAKDNEYKSMKRLLEELIR